MTRPTADSLIQEIRNTKQLLIASAERNAVDLERLAREMESRIIGLLRDGNYKLTLQQRNRLMGELAELIRVGNGNFRNLRNRIIPDLARFSVGRQAHLIAAMYGAKRLDGVSNRRIVEVFNGLAKSDRMGVAIQSSFGEWMDTWADHWRQIEREINSTLLRGVVSGLSNQDMAKQLVGPLGGIQIPGLEDPEHFAYSFARTQMADLQNRLSIVVSQELGIQQYVNVGVADDRQSLECFEASNAGPLTLKEWAAWRASNGEGGSPPRHVRNCRCVLVGLPDFAAKQDWSQPNPTVEARIARKEEREAVTA